MKLVRLVVPTTGDLEITAAYLRAAIRDCHSRGEVPIMGTGAVAAINQAVMYQDLGIYKDMQEVVDRSPVAVIRRNLPGWEDAWKKYFWACLESGSVVEMNRAKNQLLGLGSS